MGSDVGGFQGDARGELFARWMQVGAFMPFYRNHSAEDTIDQEPWSFGPPEVESISRRFLRLRYRLLPFYITSFTALPKRDCPLCGPLF